MRDSLESCVVFSIKTTGLVYRNNMFVIRKCLELRVNSIIIVLLLLQVDVFRIQYLFSIKIQIPRGINRGLLVLELRRGMMR